MTSPPPACQILGLTERVEQMVDQSTASVQSPRSGRAHEADDGLVYRSQLCRHSA